MGREVRTVEMMVGKEQEIEKRPRLGEVVVV